MILGKEILCLTDDGNGSKLSENMDNVMGPETEYKTRPSCNELYYFPVLF